MSSLNRVIILGRLGVDPEVRRIGETTIAKLSVATHSSWMASDGQKKEKTQWHRVKVFGRQAEQCEAHLSKAMSVLVEGSLEYSSYDDKEGVKRYITEIKARDVRFLGVRAAERDGSPAAAGEIRQGPAPSAQDYGGPFVPEDDVPF